MDSDTVVYLVGLVSGYWVGFVFHSPTVDRMIRGAVRALREERTDGE